MTTWIGTSGWHYRHWRGPVYPPRLPVRRWLEYYAERLDCVEINASFYRLPKPATIAEWYERTPPGFVFAVKASRYITHVKRLRDCGEALHTFLGHVEGLGEKLGPVLFQLPPRWQADPERLADFLALLPEGQPCAFEFRDESWHVREVYDLLAEHDAAFCQFELAGRRARGRPVADWTYVRLHGPGEAYQGRYDEQALRRWARRLRERDRDGQDAYLFFDNDEAGYAAENAMHLKDMLAGSRRRRQGQRP